jgi:predicted alpha/beta hydrolase
MVVFAAALGVPYKNYQPLATFLSENGYGCLLFDYRGIGASVPQDGAIRNITMHQWGHQDIEAALQFASAQPGAEQLFLLGHSCGGQLFGLAPSSSRLSGAILVAAQLAHWSLWPFPAKLGMLGLWGLLIPLMSLNRDMFPARRTGLSSVDIPAGVTREWARWARSSQYLFNPEFGLDTSRYANFRFPVQAWGFDDDGYAPAGAIDALLKRMSNIKLDRQQVENRSADIGTIGHFGFFREKMRSMLWPVLLAWLNRSGS